MVALKPPKTSAHWQMRVDIFGDRIGALPERHDSRNHLSSESTRTGRPRSRKNWREISDWRRSIDVRPGIELAPGKYADIELGVRLVGHGVGAADSAGFEAARRSAIAF